MVDVFALMVFSPFQTVPVVVSVTVLAPKVIVFPALPVTLVQLTATPFVFSVMDVPLKTMELVLVNASANVTTPVTPPKRIVPFPKAKLAAHDLPLFVIVAVVRVNITSVLLPHVPIPDPSVRFPKICGFPEKEKLGLLAIADKFIFFPDRWLPKSDVMVCPPEVTELASKTTSSCGSGMLAPDAPPLEVDQCVVELQLPVPSTQYLVVAVVAVMLELPKASPMLVPVNGAAAPAPVISMKSTFVRATAAALSVANDPNVAPRTKRRWVFAFGPLKVKVVVIVWVVPEVNKTTA